MRDEAAGSCCVEGEKGAEEVGEEDTLGERAEAAIAARLNGDQC